MSRAHQACVLTTQPAADQAPVRQELRAMLNDPVSRAENYGSLLVVLAILTLMVFK
jgi:hypothetical protein